MNATSIRLLTVTLLFSALAGWTDTLTLEQTIVIGLESNYGIRIARNNVSQANNTRKLKVGKLLPTASAHVSADYTKTIQQSSSSTNPVVSANSPSDGEPVYSAGATLGWTLFDGFRMFHAGALIDQRAHHAETLSRQDIESAVVQIVTAYYELIGARSLLDAAGEQLRLSQSQLTLMQAQWEYGRVSNQNVLSQRVAVNADSAAVARRALDAASALHTLNALLARPVSTPLTAVIDSQPTAPQHDATFWVEKAMEHNAGLQLSEIQRNIAASQAGIARAAFWPILTAHGTYAHTFGDAPTNRLSGGLSLSWTLFDGFERETNLQNTRIDMSNAELVHQKRTIELQALISQQYERLSNAYHQTLFGHEAVKLAEQSVALSEEHFKLGRISHIELREAQLALLDARVRYESALLQNKIVAVQLEQLAGVLSF